MEKVNLEDKFKIVNEYWSPALVGQLNGQGVKVAKFKGEFPKHKHEVEDELFMVIKGQCFIELDTKTIELNESEFFIVPRGTEHRPYAPEEAHVMMFEPMSTLNTGNTNNEYTKNKLETI